MTMKPKLLAIGGAHIDRRGQLSVPHVPGASNPGRMREEVGGGVFNAARNAAQLGIDIDFLSVRGGDMEADLVGREIQAAGFEDLSSVFLDRRTASYTAIIDQNGDVITALADMEIYESALPRQIARRKTRDAIDSCDAILTDANMPAEAIAKLLTLAQGKPVFAIAISPAKVVRFSGLLDKIHCLFLNRREGKALAGFGPAENPKAADIFGRLQSHGVRRAVLTDGPSNTHVLDEGCIMQLTPPAARQIADVTGAGDALAGVCTALLMQKLDLERAVAIALAAAALTVERVETVVDLRKTVWFSDVLGALSRA
jgi:pseudouridine kinase